MACQDPIRIGVLGCGSVVEYAILKPAKDDGAVTVAAIASRDAAKAEAYADRHGIPRHYGGYDALLADDGLDAIYVALPNALHCEWSIAALEAGHAVLCEKPLASNADQAATMARAAERAGKPLVEAFHWRWHPVAARVTEILASGVIGRIVKAETHFHIPDSWLAADNIRLDPALGGGAMMDPGCYCVNLLRLISPGEPEVLTAEADLLAPGLDGAMTATLRLADGVPASLACSMNRRMEALSCGATITGEAGRLILENPFMPGWGGRILIEAGSEQSVEIPVTTPSYTYQARAFAALVRDPPKLQPAWDGVANMRVIDAAYCAAGMQPRW
jgi:predicted dehydrogenase